MRKISLTDKRCANDTFLRCAKRILNRYILKTEKNNYVGFVKTIFEF